MSVLDPVGTTTAAGEDVWTVVNGRWPHCHSRRGRPAPPPPRPRAYEEHNRVPNAKTRPAYTCPVHYERTNVQTSRERPAASNPPILQPPSADTDTTAMATSVNAHQQYHKYPERPYRIPSRTCSIRSTRDIRSRPASVPAQDLKKGI